MLLLKRYTEIHLKNYYIANMKRDEWLGNALKQVNTIVFNDFVSADLLNAVQISIGIPRKKKNLSDSLIPDNMSDDVEHSIFPATLFISPFIEDPKHIIGAIIKEYIHCFITFSQKTDKKFKETAKSVGFIKPFTDYQMSDTLLDKVNTILNGLPAWPGFACYLPSKKEAQSDKKQKTPNIFFCPECGFEFKVPDKMFKEHPGYPTCMCGTKMGIANESVETPEI